MSQVTLVKILSALVFLAVFVILFMSFIRSDIQTDTDQDIIDQYWVAVIHGVPTLFLKGTLQEVGYVNSNGKWITTGEYIK